MKRPTIRHVERLLRLLIMLGANLPEDVRPGWWRGLWQRQIMAAFMAHNRVILQGPRQATGKSFLVCLLAVVFIAMGLRVVVAMPSLRQGSRILVRRILSWMVVLEPVLGWPRYAEGALADLDELERRTRLAALDPLERVVDNSLEVEWGHGAGLMALSTDAAAVKGVQGYTCALLIIDEGHETPNDTFGAYRPLVSVAMREGYGLVVILGVAGSSESLIEAKKASGQYHVECWTDEMVLELDPGWGPEFESARAELLPEEYDRFYKMIPPATGERQIFANLPYELSGFGSISAENIFPIDVGKKRDETIVGAVQVANGAMNVSAVLRMRGLNYPEQAQQAADWIYNGYMFLPRNVGVETNGPGEGFADDLANIYPFGDLRRISTTNNPPSFRKTNWIKSLMRDAVKGLIAVADKRTNEALRSLKYELTEAGDYLWPHSDELSMMWVAKAMTFRAIGV